MGQDTTYYFVLQITLSDLKLVTMTFHATLPGPISVQDINDIENVVSKAHEDKFLPRTVLAVQTMFFAQVQL